MTDDIARPLALFGAVARANSSSNIRRHWRSNRKSRFCGGANPPGIFLDGNDCTIYEARPDTCRDFPHLIRGAGSFESRMW